MSELIRYETKGTLHRSRELDIEVDPSGRIVSVWFNCMALPFRVSPCSHERGLDMIDMYKNNLPGIRAIEVGPDLQEIPAKERLSAEEEWEASVEDRSKY